MTNLGRLTGVIVAMFIITGCAVKEEGKVMKEGTFAGDLALMKKHTEILVLADSAGKARVAVAPALQGRVMTSTAGGDDGPSYGWINKELFESGETMKHINPYGGEDRFWIGPEGGQFSIFFPKGAPFDFEYWQTPAEIDTIPFDVVSASDDTIRTSKDMKLVNYSGTEFSIKVERTIQLYVPSQAMKKLGMELPEGVDLVCYETVNKMTNTGKNDWKPETGLLSIWILGMLNHSPSTTVVVPYVNGDEAKLGPIVNDEYFGKVPADRLVVKENAIYFSGDGQCRSKIGLTPQRAKSVLGSYDAESKLLTIVQYNKPEKAEKYVNSMWKIQEHPYKGDVVNSYNDGPAEPGKKPLGPFYELESSSPAAELKAGESITHIHRTFHIQGSEDGIDKIARSVLGVGVAEISSALPK